MEIDMYNLLLTLSMITLVAMLAAIAVRHSTGQIDPNVAIYATMMGIIAMCGIGQLPQWCIMIPVIVIAFILWRGDE